MGFIRNDHQWDDAETVYLQAHGSCSEYTFLFVALCRANGLPARYVGATRQRSEGVYVDTVFHRWAEVYLPPYGWVPVDVTWDDGSSGPRYDYFGAVADSLFVTTVSTQVTVSFAAQVGVPSTVGWAVTATNRACVYPVAGTRDDCVWSNEVGTPVSWPYRVHLPLVLRE